MALHHAQMRTHGGGYRPLAAIEHRGFTPAREQGSHQSVAVDDLALGSACLLLVDAGTPRRLAMPRPVVATQFRSRSLGADACLSEAARGYSTRFAGTRGDRDRRLICIAARSLALLPDRLRHSRVRAVTGCAPRLFFHSLSDHACKHLSERLPRHLQFLSSSSSAGSTDASKRGQKIVFLGQIGAA